MAKKITQNVNKDKFLNDLPSVHPDFSKWLNKFANYQSCNIGDIVPIYWDEILPNEKRKITMGMISHTTTPVAPIFPSMYTELRTFFVPMRLCADLLNGYKDRRSPWVKVFGEDPASTNADIIVPLADQKLPEVASAFSDAVVNLLDSAPMNNVFNSLDISGDDAGYNFLNLAAYELIYQRHYRNENYETATDSDLYKALFNAYNLGALAEVSFGDFNTFEVANREKDYFTGSKPFTQKSAAPISAGLSGNATVKIKNAGATSIAADTPFSVKSSASISTGGVGNGYLLATDESGDTGVLVADLKTASGISIEELRLLVKTQELLEKDALYGTRYAESLNAHFGCCPLDLTLQDPAELYRTTITSNMQAIFQTSTTTGQSSILGTIGANSTTQTDPFVILPETEFKEHGILMICAVHKLQNVYDARYYRPRFNFKKARFEFYTPELNDLGFQPFLQGEIPYMSAPAGFNEAFAEYRYKFNKVHGELVSTFPYWAPAIDDSYGTISALYKEDPTILDKALSFNHESAPQFYDAWGFEEEVTKPMSLHSIPGFDGVI